MPDVYSMGDMGFPLWGAAALAAILALVTVVAILRFGGRTVFGVLAASAVIVGMGWLALERIDPQGKADQRRAIEARVAALNAQALLPNSNLACVDAVGGDMVHEACERALFSAPEQVAAALNYVGARLDVMREIAALPDREAAAFESLRAPMLRSLQADRFGLVAQVLTARDDCRPDSCYAFDFLENRDRVVANMTERSYDARVARFAAAWSEKASASGPAAPALAAQTTRPSPPNHPVNINFPTADSIPAVSIMSNEPGRPGQNGVAAAPSPRPEPRAQPQPPAPPQSLIPPSQPSQTAPARRPAQKAQAPRPQAPPQPASPPPPAEADPFPQPVGSAQQTTGAQQQ
ncbi:MAG: hypothetical protein ACOY5F_16010 [Pseudomonadota bacterium]